MTDINLNELASQFLVDAKVDEAAADKALTAALTEASAGDEETYLGMRRKVAKLIMDQLENDLRTAVAEDAIENIEATGEVESVETADAE